MLPCRPAWAALLVLGLLLLPSAGAFSTREEPLHLAYARGETPVAFALGRLHLEGWMAGGYFASDVRQASLTGIPQMTLTEREGGGPPRNTTLRNVDVLVHGGSLVWLGDAGDRLQVQLDAPYGVGLALPKLPLPGTDAAGALVAAPSLHGTLGHEGRGSLALLDAEVTLLDATGQVLPGWERRAVNPGATPATDPADLETLLSPTGLFQGRVDAGIQGGTLSMTDRSRLTVAPSGAERFGDTLDVLSRAASLLGAQGDEAFGPQSPLRNLEPLAAMLDGAFLVLGDTAGADGAAVRPLEARIGEEAFETAPMALVRGEMAMAWDEERMSFQGTPVVAVSGGGFAVETPAAIAGLVPVVAVILWVLAGAAIVVYFVKRPPEADARWSLRLGSFALYLVVLVGAFWLWDMSFADTFGTSVLTLLFDGTAFDDPARLGLLFALETAPWGLAALLFALPVRIVLGVALRYLGKGKSFKGVAKAGGLVALALLGPVYALWLINTLLSQVFGLLPSLVG